MTLHLPVTILVDFPEALAETVMTEPFGVVMLSFCPEMLVVFPFGARIVVPAGTAYESLFATITD